MTLNGRNALCRRKDASFGAHCMECRMLKTNIMATIIESMTPYENSDSVCQSMRIYVKHISPWSDFKRRSLRLFWRDHPNMNNTKKIKKNKMSSDVRSVDSVPDLKRSMSKMNTNWRHIKTALKITQNTNSELHHSVQLIFLRLVHQWEQWIVKTIILTLGKTVTSIDFVCL